MRFVLLRKGKVNTTLKVALVGVLQNVVVLMCAMCQGISSFSAAIFRVILSIVLIKVNVLAAL